jgi:hypothetical protein
MDKDGSALWCSPPPPPHCPLSCFPIHSPHSHEKNRGAYRSSSLACLFPDFRATCRGVAVIHASASARSLPSEGASTGTGGRKGAGRELTTLQVLACIINETRTCGTSSYSCVTSVLVPLRPMMRSEEGEKGGKGR